MRPVDGSRDDLARAESILTRLLAADSGDVRFLAGLARNRATAADLDRRSGQLEIGLKRMEDAIDEIRRLNRRYRTTDLKRELDWMLAIQARFPK